MASFQSQYGIRLSRELSGMKWQEFKAFVSGFDGDTPLGRIVRIRSEEDPDHLKTFSPEMRKIRNEWQKKKAFSRSEEEKAAFIEQMKQAMISMAGGLSDGSKTG